MLKLLKNLLLLVSLLPNLPLQAMSPEDIKARQERLRELQEQNKLLGTKRTQSDLYEGNKKNPAKKPKLDENNNQIDDLDQPENDHVYHENSESFTIQPADPEAFCGFAGLPTELIHQIAGNLDLKNFRSFKSTCKYLDSSLNDEMVLRDILINKIRSRGYDQEITEPLCSYFLECMQTEHYITLKGHQSEVQSIIQLSNGNLASCGYDETIKIWDLETYQCIKTLEGRKGRFRSIIQLSDGNLASCSQAIEIWNLKTGVCIATLEEHEDEIDSIIQLSNGNLASCSDDGTIKIWNLETYQCIASLEEHEDKINSIIQLSNGNLASYSDDDETIKIWDLETYKCIDNKTLKEQELDKNGIVYFSSSDGTFCALNLNTEQYIFQLKDINKLLFNCARRQLRNGTMVFDDWSGNIHIWHPKAPRHIKTLKSQTQFINSIIQLNNGDLASCSDYETIKIWTIYPQNLSAQQIYLVLNLYKNRERNQSVKLDEFWSAVFDSLPDYLKDRYNNLIEKTD